MEKPKIRTIEGYDLMGVTDYITEKYNLELDFNDIWHWFVDNYEPSNGTKVTLETEIYEDDKEWLKP